VLLLALPLTVAIEIVLPGHAEVVLHLALAIGTFIVALSVFDFETPKTLTTIACAAACGLAAIFLAQALGALTQNETLKAFAYSQEIGGWGETITVSLVMAWLIGVALRGRGATLLIGVVSALIVVALGVWTMLAAPLGGTPAELRLLFFIPVAWLLFVSTRRSHA
jgi:hypothetical protein